MVIGGGFGGLAAAPRLAKLGHEVTLLERSGRLGGALTTEELDGFAWDAGPTSTLLPAVIRDLFRKSGRPLEREVDLQPLDLVREHRFEDGTSLRLPGGSRAAQLAAFDALAPGLGRQWVDHVASYGDTWELLRKECFERPFDADVAPRELTDLLGRRESLHKRLRKAFKRRAAAAGGRPPPGDGRPRPRATSRSSPASTSTSSSASARGPCRAGWPRSARRWPSGWTCAASRVLTGAEALDLVSATRASRRSARRTARSPADRVVVAIDPRRLPALASYVRRTMPAIPPVVCHVGPGGRACPTSRTRSCCTATRCWSCAPAAARPTAARRGPCSAAAGSPRTRCWRWPAAGSTSADRWSRASTARRASSSSSGAARPTACSGRARAPRARRLGPRTPVRGVLAAGAHATTGSGLPFAGLSAALVAELVGRA